MVWPPPTFPPTQPEGSGPSGQRAGPSQPGGQQLVETMVSHGAPREDVTGWHTRPDRLMGAIVGDRYRLMEFLGRGSLTAAYSGTCQLSGKPVVVKVLPCASSPRDDRFFWQVRKAVALAHFEHEAVRSIVDFGLAPWGDVFLVRNYCEGLPLRALIVQGSLPEQRTLSVLEEIAMALSAAHRQEVPHGRLKPENVIFDESAPLGRQVRLVDAGLGQLQGSFEQSADEARRMELRTRLYLPAGVEPRSAPEADRDTYALGVIGFEMLAGQPPFPFGERELLSRERPPPFELDQVVPHARIGRPLSHLIRGLLTPGSEQASWTADQLADWLRGYREHQAHAAEAAMAQVTAGLAHREDEVTRQVPAASELPPPPDGSLSQPPPIEAFQERPQFQMDEPPVSVVEEAGDRWGGPHEPPLSGGDRWGGPHEPPPSGGDRWGGPHEPPPSDGPPSPDSTQRPSLRPPPLAPPPGGGPARAAAPSAPPPSPFGAASGTYPPPSVQLAPVALAVDDNPYDPPPPPASLLQRLLQLLGRGKQPKDF